MFVIAHFIICFKLIQPRILFLILLFLNSDPQNLPIKLSKDKHSKIVVFKIQNSSDLCSMFKRLKSLDKNNAIN